MKRKLYTHLILLHFIIVGCMLTSTLTKTQNVSATNQMSTIYEFSISYSSESTKFNTKTNLNITYLQNTSEFLASGESIWHLPVNITDQEIRDLLASYLPTPFIAYLESHLKNESVLIPYQQRIFSNTSSNYMPSLYNPFICKSNQSQTIGLNDTFEMLTIAQTKSATVSGISKVGYASWNSDPIALAFAHATVDSLSTILETRISEQTIQMNLLYEKKTGLLLKANITITPQDAHSQLTNEVRLIDCSIPLDQEPNSMIYVYLLLTGLLPTIIAISAIFVMIAKPSIRKV